MLSGSAAEKNPSLEQMRTATDVQLVSWTQQGHTGAFGELVERYKERVYMLALQMTHSHPDADELSQQAFLKAFECLGQFRGDANFFTWVYRITVNLSLTYLKRRERFEPLPEPGNDETYPKPELASKERTEGALEEDDTRREVWAALDTLSPELRAAVVLVYIQDLSPREAAESLGCAEATVHWRLFKARKKLKKVIKGAQ